MNNPAQKLDALSDPDWERIMSLSQEMLEGARSEDWGRVCELQDERFERIRHYFSGSPRAADLEGIRTDVNRLLAMDQEITDLGRKARHELAKGLKALRTGRNAHRAYRR